jgi:CPA1 family monovalent cation:H+ antiporter
VVSPATRIQGRAVWNLVVFMTNALIFVLLGVQFGELIEAVPAGALGSIVRTGLVISGIVILVRLAWVPIATVLPRWLSAELRRQDPMPPARSVLLIAWTSMRGVVSLASALALPLMIEGGARFPYRAEIILITMCVIVVTLVVQGLSLSPLIRWLRFPPDHSQRQEEAHARREALRHALERLQDLAEEGQVRPEEVELIREEYRRRGRHHAALAESGHQDGDERKRIRAEALKAERRSLIRLRDEGAISDEVLQHLEQELDVEALRIGVGEVR